VVAFQTETALQLETVESRGADTVRSIAGG
jgi:hypothetical protein